MKELIVVACRSEAKIFSREHQSQNLQWQKTLVNRKGRRKERDFYSDAPGVSYAKFSGNSGPHLLSSPSLHSEVVAIHFAQQIAKYIISAYREKKFSKLSVFAGAHFLGILKSYLGDLEKWIPVTFIPKNIEKRNTEDITSYLEEMRF